MEIAIFSLVGAVVLNASWAWVTGKVRRYRNLQALRIEVDEAIRIVSVYMDAGVSCPLYRVPMVALDNSGVELVKGGVFTASQLEAFLQYGNQVTQINRGLDYMNDHRVRVLSNASGDLASDPLGSADYRRVIEKCKELRDSYGLSMRAAVADRLKKSWVGRLADAVVAD